MCIFGADFGGPYINNLGHMGRCCTECYFHSASKTPLRTMKLLLLIWLNKKLGVRFGVAKA